MWSTEYTAETNVPVEAVWAALRDLHTGTKLSDRSDTFEIQGPFAVGTEISVTPRGQDTFRSTIVELVENEVYADRTELSSLSLLFRHTLAPLVAGGTRITHTLVIDGPAASQVGPELGPQISEDFPVAMDELIAAATLRATEMSR
jgi:hypothetical protein